MQNAGKERKVFFIKKEDCYVIYEFDEETSRLKKIKEKDIENEKIYNMRRYRGFKRLTDEERSIGYYLKELKKIYTFREL